MTKQKKRRRPNGYWRSWENLERELQKLTEELGHFPSTKELKALGHSDIISASSYHGYLSAVRARMGYKPSTKPAGYWQQWANFERELREVIDNIGHFPFSGELEALGRQGIIVASRHHGGLNAVRARMGFEQAMKPKGYWKQWGNFERELRKVIDALGHFPSTSELKARGRRDICLASQYHGNISAVRAKMGFKGRKPQNYWKQRENFERELQEVVERLGHSPSTMELRALGRQDIIGGSKYHDIVLPAFREAPTKPPGYWRSWENLERELREVVEGLGHFPSQSELATLGRHDILGATRHHGYLTAIRARMGLERLTKPHGYWRSWENLERGLRGVIQEIGHFPSSAELEALGRRDILSACKYYGHISAVRKKMGYEQTRKPNSYWHSIDNFERELREVIGELGFFPSTRNLAELGRNDILSALKHHGRLSAVRTRMGYGSSPRAAAAKFRSLAAIPGLADEEFVAVIQTVPGLEDVSENVILKHRTRLNLGPLELPPATLDGGGVTFWEHCLEELQAKHPAPERLEELWILERIAARLHRAASIEVLGREPVTAEDERRVVEFLERRAQEKRAA